MRGLDLVALHSAPDSSGVLFALSSARPQVYAWPVREAQCVGAQEAYS